MEKAMDEKEEREAGAPGCCIQPTSYYISSSILYIYILYGIMKSWEVSASFFQIRVYVNKLSAWGCLQFNSDSF